MHDFVSHSCTRFIQEILKPSGTLPELSKRFGETSGTLPELSKRFGETSGTLPDAKMHNTEYILQFININTYYEI
jgi:hypothetical protein